MQSMLFFKLYTWKPASLANSFKDKEIFKKYWQIITKIEVIYKNGFLPLRKNLISGCSKNVLEAFLSTEYDLYIKLPSLNWINEFL